jgi:hypothetical protein
MLLVQVAKSFAEVIMIDSDSFNRSCFDDATVALFLRMKYWTGMKSEIKGLLERKIIMDGLVVASFNVKHIVEIEKDQMLD